MFRTPEVRCSSSSGRRPSFRRGQRDWLAAPNDKLRIARAAPRPSRCGTGTPAAAKQPCHPCATMARRSGSQLRMDHTVLLLTLPSLARIVVDHITPYGDARPMKASARHLLLSRTNRAYRQFDDIAVLGEEVHAPGVSGFHHRAAVDRLQQRRPGDLIAGFGVPPDHPVV